jgi:hypothetical protein
MGWGSASDSFAPSLTGIEFQHQLLSGFWAAALSGTSFFRSLVNSLVGHHGKYSQWRTLKVSRECRWRDLLRQQEA